MSSNRSKSWEKRLRDGLVIGIIIALVDVVIGLNWAESQSYSWIASLAFTALGFGFLVSVGMLVGLNGGRGKYSVKMTSPGGTPYGVVEYGPTPKLAGFCYGFGGTALATFTIGFYMVWRLSHIPR